LISGLFKVITRSFSLISIVPNLNRTGSLARLAAFGRLP
jgi:hypothetical protein